MASHIPTLSLGLPAALAPLASFPQNNQPRLVRRKLISYSIPLPLLPLLSSASPAALPFSHPLSILISRVPLRDPEVLVVAAVVLVTTADRRRDCLPNEQNRKANRHYDCILSIHSG